MKVMLISTIRGKESNAEAISTIVRAIETAGNTCFHDHLSSATQQSLDNMKKEENLNFHRSIIEKIKESDVVVSESSHESLSVGYLISTAIDLGKPVIIFYNASSAAPNIFPTLSETGKIYVVKYSTVTELTGLVSEYIDYANEQVDVRFNFFISPKIGQYLDWVSRNKKLPRSVYLRNLIEADMERNPEYEAKVE
jgi:hypothetical protein